MNRQDFFYDLPQHLIAQHPSPERDASRMMLLNRHTGQIEHRCFNTLVSLLKPGDCLVLNDSKVIPARLIGTSAKPGSQGAQVEMLLHERLDEKHWEVLVKPGKKGRPGDTVIFGGGLLTAQVEKVTEDGLRIVTMTHDGPIEPLLEKIGEMPLPHYIREKPSDASEKARYQTVYAAHEGSVAAPTAGLHFTDEILCQVQEAGVHIARVTLHVGIGTFRPVKANDITEHHMHSEYCRIEPAQAAVINETRKCGGRVIAVGTTSCRTLESRAEADGTIIAGAGRTDIFIYPGYRFRVIDGLLTNFHLPESTLLMLVSAFAGREQVLNAYHTAVENEYRFFSYGDCMLIL